MPGKKRSRVPQLTLIIGVLSLAVHSHADSPRSTATSPVALTDEIRLDVGNQETDTDQPALFGPKSLTFSTSLLDRFWYAEPHTGPFGDLDWLDAEPFTLLKVSFDSRTPDDEDPIAFEAEVLLLHNADANAELQWALSGFAPAFQSKVPPEPNRDGK